MLRWSSHFALIMHVSLLYYYLSTSEMVHTDANVAIRNYLNYYICALDYVFVALAKMGIKISLVTFKVNCPISTLRRTEKL